MGIFSEYAPLYWNAGLPVFPLRRWNDGSSGAGKAPMIKGWNRHCEEMPSTEVQSSWLQEFPDCNVGLPLGPCSGLCAIDIDTDNLDEIKAIQDVLPPALYQRIGKKGMVLIFRWDGQPNFKVRLSDGRQPVEFLGKGNQVVVPGSVHPETGQPYTATANLWEIV